MPINRPLKKILSHPNTLTLFRVAAVPVIVLLLLFPNRLSTLVAALFFIVAAITDFLDGFFARQKGLISDFGKVMDPIADKLLVSSAFIMLASLGWVPSWIVCIIIGREIADREASCIPEFVAEVSAEIELRAAVERKRLIIAWHRHAGWSCR